jgi:hypothetical protein
VKQQEHPWAVDLHIIRFRSVYSSRFRCCQVVVIAIQVALYFSNPVRSTMWTFLSSERSSDPVIALSKSLHQGLPGLLSRLSKHALTTWFSLCSPT